MSDAPHLATRVLFQSDVGILRDVDCHAPRSPAGAEERASSHLLIFPRAGVFVRHAAARGRRHTGPIVADATHAILLDSGEPYRVSHPTVHGDRCTVLALPPEVVRDVAASGGARADDEDGPAFAATHVLVPPAARVRLAALRAGLIAARMSTLTAETVTLELLHAVLAARTSSGTASRGTAIAARPATRTARRELAQAVREVLASDPAANVPLATLARRVAASPFHLTRVFHAEVGVPVHQYQLRLRLALAVDRLAEDTGTLATLGLELGFASHGHFTRAFSRAYGMTPTAARAAIRDRGAHGMRLVAAGPEWGRST